MQTVNGDRYEAGMKGIAPFFLGLLQMVGCSVGLPPSEEIDAIEKATSKTACVGSLDRWHRKFAFQKRGDRVNREIISVTYTQAGYRNLPAGRYSEEPGYNAGIIDDGEFRRADGEYDRIAHRFIDWECGCNFPPYDVDHEIECPAIGG